MQRQHHSHQNSQPINPRSSGSQLLQSIIQLIKQTAQPESNQQQSGQKITQNNPESAIKIKQYEYQVQGYDDNEKYEECYQKNKINDKKSRRNQQMIKYMYGFMEKIGMNNVSAKINQEGKGLIVEKRQYDQNNSGDKIVQQSEGKCFGLQQEQQNKKIKINNFIKQLYQIHNISQRIQFMIKHFNQNNIKEEQINTMMSQQYKNKPQNIQKSNLLQQLFLTYFSKSKQSSLPSHKTLAFQHQDKIKHVFHYQPLQIFEKQISPSQQQQNQSDCNNIKKFSSVYGYRFISIDEKSNLYNISKGNIIQKDNATFSNTIKQKIKLIQLFSNGSLVIVILQNFIMKIYEFQDEYHKQNDQKKQRKQGQINKFKQLKSINILHSYSQKHHKISKQQINKTSSFQLQNTYKIHCISLSISTQTLCGSPKHKTTKSLTVIQLIYQLVDHSGGKDYLTGGDIVMKIYRIQKKQRVKFRENKIRIKKLIQIQEIFYNVIMNYQQVLYDTVNLFLFRFKNFEKTQDERLIQSKRIHQNTRIFQQKLQNFKEPSINYTKIEQYNYFEPQENQKIIASIFDKNTNLQINQQQQLNNNHIKSLVLIDWNGNHGILYQCKENQYINQFKIQSQQEWWRQIDYQQYQFFVYLCITERKKINYQNYQNFEYHKKIIKINFMGEVIQKYNIFNQESLINTKKSIYFHNLNSIDSSQIQQKNKQLSKKVSLSRYIQKRSILTKQESYQITDFVIYQHKQIAVISTKKSIIYYSMKKKQIIGIVQLDKLTTKSPISKIMKLDDKLKQICLVRGQFLQVLSTSKQSKPIKHIKKKKGNQHKQLRLLYPNFAESIFRILLQIQHQDHQLFDRTTN